MALVLKYEVNHTRQSHRPITLFINQVWDEPIAPKLGQSQHQKLFRQEDAEAEQRSHLQTSNCNMRVQSSLLTMKNPLCWQAIDYYSNVNLIYYVSYFRNEMVELKQV